MGETYKDFLHFHFNAINTRIVHNDRTTQFQKVGYDQRREIQLIMKIIETVEKEKEYSFHSITIPKPESNHSSSVKLSKPGLFAAVAAARSI